MSGPDDLRRKVGAVPFEQCHDARSKEVEAEVVPTTTLLAFAQLGLDEGQVPVAIWAYERAREEFLAPWPTGDDGICAGAMLEEARGRAVVGRNSSDARRPVGGTRESRR